MKAQTLEWSVYDVTLMSGDICCVGIIFVVDVLLVLTRIVCVTASGPILRNFLGCTISKVHV